MTKNNKIKKDGNLVLLYLVLYSIVRIIVESFRIDSVKYVLGQPVAIFVSVGIIILSIILFFINNRQRS